MSLLSIALFFIVLGFLVFVHELGHFLTAIRSGIKAEEFGFGFPPRLAGLSRDDADGRWKIILGNREVRSSSTVYSVNWIPFGGFVRMKGEDENALDDPDSFAAKSVGIRVAVLSAGVIMNMLLAWILVSSLFVFGFPQPITDDTRAIAEDVSIRILGVAPESPAEMMGIQPGDRLVSVDSRSLGTLEEAQEVIAALSGRNIAVGIVRGDESFVLHGIPRSETPEGEGALGISFAEIGTVKYPWYEAPVRGMWATGNATLSILRALGGVVAGVFVGKGGGETDITGPVGIVYVTKQMSDLGLPYLIQFAAILSINLAIFNILPLPALDGGRILFVLIERIKGSPVREIVEQRTHQVGFLLLLFAMIAVTMRDFSKFEILRKIADLFR